MTENTDQKKALRREMKERRAEAYKKNPDAARQLRDQFLKSISLPAGAVIAGYAAQGSEIDPHSLLEALQARGHRLALPVMGGADDALLFRAYKPGDALTMRADPAIPEPPATAALVEPDIILVPLLAFDAKHNRLGRGGGHYDRTLLELRRRRAIVAIGFAFACQRVELVPAGPGDACLDKIVTELEAF